MPSHWTYANFDESAELEQGDILSPTVELRGLLSRVHPHFGDDKYLGYIITTQSCDLVRRRKLPKATYINIAVIRPLSQIIQKIVAEVATPVGVGVFKTSDRGEAYRLLERVFNQNEQAIGLFFLHPDTDAGIAEPAVAFLRVSIALRAAHYEVLRSSRVGKLTAEFRGKLGWLTGNLYIRPATPDWGDTEDGKQRFDELIRQYMGETRWLDDEIVNTAQQQGINVTTATHEQLEALRPPSHLDRAIEEVRAELRRVAPESSPDAINKLGNRLRNNGKFTKLLRA
jgi:hypothetical protein